MQAKQRFGRPAAVMGSTVLDVALIFTPYIYSTAILLK